MRTKNVLVEHKPQSRFFWWFVKNSMLDFTSQFLLIQTACRSDVYRTWKLQESGICTPNFIGIVPAVLGENGVKWNHLVCRESAAFWKDACLTLTLGLRFRLYFLWVSSPPPWSLVCLLLTLVIFPQYTSWYFNDYWGENSCNLLQKCHT